MCRTSQLKIDEALVAPWVIVGRLETCPTSYERPATSRPYGVSPEASTRSTAAADTLATADQSDRVVRRVGHPAGGRGDLRSEEWHGRETVPQRRCWLDTRTKHERHGHRPVIARAAGWKSSTVSECSTSQRTSVDEYPQNQLMHGVVPQSGRGKRLVARGTRRKSSPLAQK